MIIRKNEILYPLHLSEFLLLCLLFFASAAMADTPLPKDLYYKGKPIEASCFEFPIESGENAERDLTQCERPQYSEGTGVLHEKGFTGYDYTEKTAANSLNKSFVYYKYLGEAEGLHAVWIKWGGGGTGRFDAINLIERKGDKIILRKDVIGGDRCNGGVVDASIKEGKIYYKINITPPDFLTIAKNDPYEVQPYRDLEASAGSCFGEAEFLENKLLNVAIGADDPAQNEKGWTERFRYQKCFNNLYNKFIAAGNKNLNPELLLKFTKSFNDECVEK